MSHDFVTCFSMAHLHSVPFSLEGSYSLTPCPSVGTSFQVPFVAEFTHDQYLRLLPFPIVFVVGFFGPLTTCP